VKASAYIVKFLPAEVQLIGSFVLKDCLTVAVGCVKNHPTPIEIYDMDIVSNYIVLLSMISPYTGRNNWYLYMQTEILFPRLLHVRKSIFIPCACWGGARGTPQVIKFSNLIRRKASKNCSL